MNHDVTGRPEHLAVAATAAYLSRTTGAADVALAVGDRVLHMRVGDATTAADLVAQAADPQTPDGSVPPVPAVARVAFGSGPERAGELTFVVTDGSRVRATGDSGSGDPAAHAARVEHVLAQLRDAGPDAAVGDLDVLTPDEHHSLMHVWNDTAHDVPAATLPELVEASAAAHPDRLAITHRGVRLTYGELNARANRIAHLLLAAGAGPGDVVAMVLPRSIDYAVTAVAIDKTGAAYLPVDTGYPLERITQVLSDAGVSHAVTIGELTDSVLVDAEQLVLDDPATVARLDAAPDGDPTDADRRAPLTPDVPAYVLYTSGSTGRPKGVVVAHRAITNRLHHMQYEIPLGPDDRLLQKTPAGFDPTVREVFWPLLAGATIVVADPEGHRDPAYLAETIVAEQVTITHFVPSGLKMFLQEPDAAGATSLRRVVCGGEALPAELQAWFASVLPADLYNVYGPTEAAVDVSSMLCPRDPQPGPVLIGRPVWNTQLYVLDEQRRLLPPGVRGELYLAGVQLAEGYLGQPELTAERFVDDPFGGPGARMYRSGDSACWRADGEIEFFGRLDHQVKIRGFRVELEEIESVLLRDGQLSQAVCLVREDNPGEQRLVAYVVAATGADPDTAKLRAQVASALPDYMVPDAFVTLDALPLTSNEKLDRAALPRPEIVVDRTGRAPGTPEEQMVAGLVATLLDVPVPGAEQDFFDLGGDSLQIGQLIQRIRERTGVRLRMRHMLEDPTVQGIAALMPAGSLRDVAG